MTKIKVLRKMVGQNGNAGRKSLTCTGHLMVEQVMGWTSCLEWRQLQVEFWFKPLQKMVTLKTEKGMKT
jgi:hypothetical protein